MMQKNLIIVAIISVLCTTAVNMKINGISSSSMERGFTRRFGASGYLSQASTYYQKYQFKKNLCCKRESDVKPPKKLSESEQKRRRLQVEKAMALYASYRNTK